MEDVIPNMTESRFRFSLKNKIARFFWGIVSLVLFQPFAFRIFRKWRIFLLRCFGAKISWSCTIHSNVKIWAPWNLEMKPYSCLGPRVDCYNQGKITIGHNATVSQKAYLCASSHDYTSSKHELILGPISIGSRAWVAADAFVGPGVTIGEGTVIGARSVVSKDMPDWMVCAGNPCKPLKERIISN